VPQTYADQFIDWLVEGGYDTCFFLAGGNIMHLLNSARTRVTCIPVVHEVAAGIAAEYFNATRPQCAGKAFALVTAGPGVTNILTSMAGAYLESRELLVVAGQVKSSDLAGPELRQRGIQEVDALALAAPVTKATLQISVPQPQAVIAGAIREASSGRQGPVLIDFCLDAQAAPPLPLSPWEEPLQDPALTPECSRESIAAVATRLVRAKRPILLLGGGVSRELGRQIIPRAETFGLPVATSWNALDRIGSDSPVYFGRPDTWGMRWANLLVQQADLIIAVGARLSLQQTGFNWQAFAPLADVVHVDVDVAELYKEHPCKWRALQCSAEVFLPELFETLDSAKPGDWAEWRYFGSRVRDLLPLDDEHNETGEGYLSPYAFVAQLSAHLTEDDVLVPCSSGGASTVLMQAFEQKVGQIVINNKALASMGYGLSGAIGAALANPNRRVVLVEGDGGFAQNLQELGTVRAQGLRLKIFLYENRGYASIRMTQRNYFQGVYVGCDEETGVGFPNWMALAFAYGIPAHVLDPKAGLEDPRVAELMATEGPAVFVVPVDPEQTYYPKITSRVASDGTMQSRPLHLMTPDLPADLARQVMPYLEEEVE
jgi:acetolactate synthase-1/2/3 large subunit